MCLIHKIWIQIFAVFLQRVKDYLLYSIQGSFIQYARKIFRKINIGYSPDMYTYVCVSGGKKF